MKKFHLTTLAAAAALLVPAAMQAVPAYPGLIKVTQKDGTQVEVRKVGDEYGFYYTTDDYKPLVKVDGQFYYAKAGDENTPFVSTGIPFSATASRSAEATQLDNADTERALRFFGMQREANKAARMPKVAVPDSRANGDHPVNGNFMSTTGVPTLGKQKAIVILVEYKDVPFTVEDAHDFYNRQFNEKGFSDYGATGSARDFFYDSSKGKYEPEFDVYGPVRLSQNRAFYGANPNGGQGDARPAIMAAEGMQMVAEQYTDADFSVYDTDKDGYIDNITVIYAGQGEASGGSEDCVWPHAGYISGAGVELIIDDVRADRYNCINEWVKDDKLKLDRPMGIGTIVHEFSHILGLTDLYDTAYSTQIVYTPGEWSVMDSGPYNNDGLTPPLHSAFEAYSLGWIDPIIVDSDCEVTLNPHGEAIYIKTDKENEFYMFEARNRATKWDEYLPGDGMLVWHIDYNESIWKKNTPNNYTGHQYIDLIEADGRHGTSSRKGDAWPGRRGTEYTEFTFQTNPSFQSWSGYDMQLPITRIHRNEWGQITFRVGKGGQQVGIENIENADDNNAPVEWYTLQGVRVDNPSGGIFIRRQGTQVTKELLK